MIFTALDPRTGRVGEDCPFGAVVVLVGEHPNAEGGLLVTILGDETRGAGR